MYVSVSLSVRQASSAALLALGIRLRDFAPETVFCERARRTDEDSGQMTGTWKTRVHFFKFVQICSGADLDESSTKHKPKGVGVDPVTSEAQALEAGLNWSLSLFFTEL